MKQKLLSLVLLLCALIVGSGSAWADDPVTIYLETFGTTGNKTDVSSYTGFSSSVITPTSTAWKISGPSTSTCNLSGSYGSCNAYCGSTSDFIFNFGDKLSNYTNVILSFNYNKGAGNGKANTIKCYISGDGGTTYGSDIIPSNTGAGGWYAVTNISIPAASLSNLCIKFSSTTNTNRIDDIKIIGTPAAPTTHTLTYSATNGSISGVNASSAAVASGASVDEGATVSLTATPSSGYTFSSWSVSGTGSTLSSTTTNPTTFTMGTADATVTANFVASTTVATPSFTVSEGTYNATQSVEINCGTDGATIYYTTDGTDPTNSSSEYSSAISVTQTTTIKAFAVKDGMTNSAIGSATYTLKCVAPSFDPAAGSVGYGTAVTLSTTTDGATIYYTTNGDIPTSSSSTYDSSNKPTVTGNQTFKAIATKTGWSDSDMSSADYTYYYVITAVSNNDSYGTVSGTTTITATPEDGYRVVAGDGGYTVTSGTATVTNNGDNTFSVTPTSNCTIQINFEAIPTHTATFSVNGSTTTQDFAEGASITFPSDPSDSNGKTFVGWYTEAYSHATNAPSYVNTATATMGNSDVTYYAVYADMEVGDPMDVTLSNSTISSNSSKNSYSNDYNIENWTGRYMINNNAGVYSLQLGYNTSSTKSAYNSHLTTPNCPADIKSITIETQNSTASGRQFFLCDADNLGCASSSDATYGFGSLSQENGSVTINVSGSTKQLHIYPDGTAYIKTITLIYQSVSIANYTTDTRADAGITYANATMDVKLGSGSTGQALTNTNSVTVTYSSSDETVATVNSSTGAITELKKAGSTTITATFAGNATYKPAEVSYTLNVTEKTPHGLAYATDEVEKLTTDDAFTNTLTNGYSLTVSYSSSATGVATVNASTGEVTIKGAGSTTITASFAGNETYEAGSASYTLTVSKAAPTLSFASANAIGREGEAFAGNALTTNPANLTVSYSSSNTEVATVNSENGAVTILADGTTTITASFAGNDTYTSGCASYTLKVLDTPTITVSNQTIAWGETFTVDDTAITGGEITVTSGNESIATVDGLEITPDACGTVTITVSTAENETYKAGSNTFTLTVTAPEGSDKAPSSEVTYTFDFSDNTDWGFPTDATTGENTYTKNGKTITLNASSDGYKYYSGGPALLIGKNGATLTLPAFDKPITKISTTGVSGSSGKVTQNIYVGETAVSESTTSAQSDHEYAINSSYQEVGTIYTFKVTNANNTQLSDLTVHMYNAPTTTVTLNQYGYGTYCSQYPLDFSSTEGYTAWRISDVDASERTITFQKITETIKGGQGVLLYNKNADGENKSDVTVKFADGDTEYTSSENMLVGTTAPTYVTTEKGDYTNFGLKGNEFVKINAGTIKAGKAYLPVLTASLPAAQEGRAFTFVFLEGDETTGIHSIEKGKLTMVDGAWYTLGGQKMNGKPATKGIYIINGKKVVIK